MAKHARRSSRFIPAAAGLAAVSASVLVPVLTGHASAQPLRPVQPGTPGQPARPHGTTGFDTTARPDRPARPAGNPGHYIARRGDTLSSIAARFCGNPLDYWSLAAASGIANPNVIHIGEYIKLACQAAYQHATGAPPVAGPQPAQATVTSFTGMLSCAGLEALWRAAGGPAEDEVTAASVAMAESGGNQFALSPTDDYGYWQINASHGPGEATFNAMGNARAAVEISDGGSNWGAWTTFTDGAYYGRC
jgi:hypothetical protein